jgi:hypothetical protein
MTPAERYVDENFASDSHGIPNNALLFKNGPLFAFSGLVITSWYTRIDLAPPRPWSRNHRVTGEKLTDSFETQQVVGQSAANNYLSVQACH